MQSQLVGNKNQQGECTPTTGFFEQQVDALTTHHFQVDTSGGKRREGETRRRDIINVNQRNVLRNIQTTLVDGA